MRRFFPVRQFRFIRCAAVMTSLMLVMSIVVVSPSRPVDGQSYGPAPNQRARKVKPVPPVKGKPPIDLPNLDEIRTHPQAHPQVRPAIPSSVRSKHKPLPSRSAGNVSLSGAADESRPKRRGNHARRDITNSPILLPTNITYAHRALARMDPFNQSGNQLQARDCEWGLTLLSLPGRAGLDLGLTLSYSSGVWTKVRNSLNFDEDQDTISPGFRLGFPTIGEAFLDIQANVNARVMVTSAGRRVELRQVAAGVYESADSSYLRLTEGTNDHLTLQTPDGTQILYARYGTAQPGYVWQATKVQDRNGNYISITNQQLTGDILMITDTLGRQINFLYDDNANLNAIVQSWNGATHYWATFGWGAPLTINASSLNGAVGMMPVDPIAVLREVNLPDGSHYAFDYTPAGQVNTVHYYGSDNAQRSYQAYDYDNSTNDCPRLQQMRLWAQNWTGIDGIPNEVTTVYGVDGDGGHRLTLPDGTVYKEFYGGAQNWQRGLVTQTKSYAMVTAANSDSDPNPTWEKKTTTAYVQDGTAADYATNPRVSETNIYDRGGNHRRTTIDYWPLNLVPIALPETVTEYGADGVSPERFSQHFYKWDNVYMDKHIIGLPAADYVFNGAWQVAAKTTYDYDAGNLESLSPVPMQYESPGFGRGNLTSVTRWDATDAENFDKRIITATYGYDMAGSLSFTRDALEHKQSLSYTDAFSDETNRNTFAYPTVLTDADGYQTFTKYDFNNGLQTFVQTPKPDTEVNVAGPIQTFTYDDALRLVHVTNDVNNAFTHYYYGPNWSATLSTVNDFNSLGYAAQVFDGAGRLIQTASDNPAQTSSNGVAGYRAQWTSYDLMGRMTRQSNPAEITSSWVPTGDDSSGLYFTYQSYDWKGRAATTTNQDGTQKYISYEGCGCAGGEVTTQTDEMGRRQRVYADVLGRQWKTELLNWDGSIYSTTVSVFNARDQVSAVNQYTGAAPYEATSTNESASCPSGSCQQTTMGYDGYGRLQSKHLPEQRDESNNPTYTTWTYKPDDTIESVRDGRGAITTYVYNYRHLVKETHHTAPSGITPAINPTATVTFAYDGAGNRKSMTDGLGSMSYSYNQLSRLTSETRTISDPANPPVNGATRTISYDYNLVGELTRITDPTNASIYYSYDSVGHLADSTRGLAVTGSAFGGVTTYASNIQYRAFNHVKSLTYGNSKVLTAAYDNRMSVSSFEVAGLLKKSYQRYADGAASFIQDQMAANSKFDRAYNYDHAGRVTSALSGAEARAGAPTDDRPYNETLGYDAMGHLATRAVRQWNRDVSSTPATFVNNRNSSFRYDADGRVMISESGTYVYDAAGAIVSFGDSAPYMTDQVMDGDGRRVKAVQGHYDDQTGQWITDSQTYYLHSTVLGQPLTELTGAGEKQTTYVYANGSLLARQSFLGTSEWVTWEHRDPEGASVRVTDAAGQEAGLPGELDPLGSNAGLAKPFSRQAPRSSGQLVPFRGLPEMNTAGRGCVLDGIETDCYLAYELSMNGAVESKYTGDSPSRPESISDTPIYGRFCVTASGGGKVVTTCTTEITGYVPGPQLQTHAADRPQNPGLTPQQTKARNLLGECGVQALLDTLSYSEDANYNTVVKGTVLKAPGHPELVGKTNVTVPNFSGHPNILVQAGRWQSTAAGRYQFLHRTWTALGLPSFSPSNQDIGAVMLMQRRGMITPLLNGDVEQAIENGNAEWASLPGSPYGQGTRSMNSLRKVYDRSFLNCVEAMHEIHQGLRDDNGV